MLKEVINRARGQARIRVTCPYPERVLNLCSARNLAFWDLEWEGEAQFTCRVSRQDFRVLRQNGEKLDCEFHVLGREGAPYALGRLRRRQALAAGLLLWGVWLVLSSVLIWDIRITGNETVPKEEILRSLEKNGVRRGTWGLSVNGEDIRNHMLLHNPQTTHLFNIDIKIIMVLPIYRPGYPKSLGQRGITIATQDLNMTMIISGLLIFDNNSEYIPKRNLIRELFLKAETFQSNPATGWIGRSHRITCDLGNCFAIFTIR